MRKWAAAGFVLPLMLLICLVNNNFLSLGLSKLEPAYAEKNLVKNQELSQTAIPIINVNIKGDGESFLGAFIRGESIVDVSGSLVDEEGNPIPDAEIRVYLNISATESVTIGTYYTDSIGNFEFSFLLPMETQIGNRTLKIYFPGDLSRGLGPAATHYWMWVYGKVYVSVNISRTRLALFENNVTVFSWVYMDNGTIVSRENMTLNLTLIRGSAVITSFNLTTDENGFNFTNLYFSEIGDYQVIVAYNISLSENNISRFLLSEYQSIESGIIVGPSISNSTSNFTVYLATKIELHFLGILDDRYDANRSGDSVEIIGTFYNISGYPDSALLNFTIWYSNGSLFKSIEILSESDGSFSLILSVNYTFAPDVYKLNCSDMNSSTIDIVYDLRLGVISKIEINISSINPPINDSVIASGTRIRIEGLTYDGIDGRNLSMVQIRAYLVYGSDEKFLSSNLSATNGNFYLTFVLPTNIPVALPEIKLEASYTELYTSTAITFTIQVYNYRIIDIRLNTSLYEWIIRDNNILAQNPTILQAENFPTLIRVNVSFYDDFNRPLNMTVLNVVINDSVNVFSGSYSPNFVFSLDISGPCNITFYIEDVQAEVTIEIEGVSITPTTTGTAGFEIPYPVLIFTAIAIPSLVLLVFMGNIKELIYRKISRESLDSFSILLVIEKLIAEKNYVELARQIKNFVFQLARELEVFPAEYMTVREVLFSLIETKKRLLEHAKADLENLVKAYEEIVYGHRTLDEKELKMLKETVSNLYIFINSLKEKEKVVKSG